MISPTPETIRAALSFVSPDLPREDWVRLGMAVKDGLNGDGFPIFDEWSKGGQSYDAADCRDTWKSLKADGKVTVGTLFYLAKQAGWKPNGEAHQETPEERQARAESARKRAQDEADREARKRAGALLAARTVYGRATECVEYPYLAKKGVPPAPGLRIIDAREALAVRSFGPNIRAEAGPWLIIPMYGPDGELCGLEAIDASGGKGFMAGGSVGLFVVGTIEAGKPVAVAEGLATALSVREATGYAVAVAFSSSSLPKAAEAIRAKHPEAHILIAGDRENGEDQAREAAKATGAALVLPEFTPEQIEAFRHQHNKPPTDFNDLAELAGLDAVRVQVGAALAAHQGIARTRSRLLRERGMTDPDSPGGAPGPTAEMGEEKSQIKYPPNPSEPSATRVSSIRYPSGNHPISDGLPEPGALLWEPKNGELTRVIESRAAEIVAESLRGRLAWDGVAGSWVVWAGTHWEPQHHAADADKMLADVIHRGTTPVGFRPNYLRGIVNIVQWRGLLEPPPHVAGAVPFRNGLLDLTTRELRAATPSYATDWCLPHDYAPEADCPTTKAWLLRSVSGDTETVELLRAWLAALVRGLSIQKFLLLLGRGGSGKGTFQRLATALVGDRNVAVSTLRDLEENRFETAKLYGKRLCSINEAGRHGGKLDMLKAVTGGDHLPLERKHVQQTGTFVFDGLVLLASNEPIQSTDTTSGLERRRITVRFPHSATPAEKADWIARGGEAAVLHSEIPGLVNWLLELSETEIRARFENPPARVAADNLLGMAAGNSVADWMVERTTPDPDAWAQVGVRKERRDPSNGAVYYEHSSEWLYPSYLTWCLEHGRNHPVSIRKFGDTLADMAEHLGHPIKQGRHPVTRAASIQGLRFLRMDDPSDSEVSGWMEGWIKPVPRMDRMDGRENIAADFFRDGPGDEIEGEL